MTRHLRILDIHPGITGYYDGRVEGYRTAKGPNWVDDGAISVGIASYAVHDGEEALVYDTHVSLDHARAIRSHLESLGVRHITVVLSHWHLDHVAGTEVFKNCEIIACRRTAEHLAAKRAAIESGSLEGAPAISPLVLPTRTFEGRMALDIGSTRVELIEANIHSDDATVLWLPRTHLLLAGDTMEDTVTFVGEPEHFDTHLADLDRLWALDPERILPNHGDPDWIASGGYPKTLIRATQQYIRALKRMRDEPALHDVPLRELIAGPLGMEWITYFAGYEEVHRLNVELVRRLG